MQPPMSPSLRIVVLVAIAERIARKRRAVKEERRARLTVVKDQEREAA